MEIRLATNEIVKDYLNRPWPKARTNRPAVRINMLASFDGKVNRTQEYKKPNEKGIGSYLDKYIMKVLRTRADMVLNGAETLRSSGAKPIINQPELESIRHKEGFSKHPIGAVLSRKGNDLPLDSEFFTSPDFEALVFLWESASAASIKRIKSTGRKVFTFADNDLKALLKLLRQRFGVERLLVEGGPSVNDAFIKAGIVDELYLTTSYKIVSGTSKEGIKSITDGASLKIGEEKDVKPLSIYYVPETNELFQSVTFENN